LPSTYFAEGSTVYDDVFHHGTADDGARGIQFGAAGESLVVSVSFIWLVGWETTGYDLKQSVPARQRIRVLQRLGLFRFGRVEEVFDFLIFDFLIGFGLDTGIHSGELSC
jgi:hypothetical protein